MSDVQGNPVEEWRPVVGYEGTYEVSGIGRVRRSSGGVNTWPGRILKTFMTANGYLFFRPCRGGHHAMRLIHRAVCESFIGPCPCGHEANHINGIKSDNRASNLEWVTHAENTRHSRRVLGRCIGSLNGSAKLSEVDIPIIRQRLADGATQRKVAREFGVCQRTITKIANRIEWTHVN